MNKKFFIYVRISDKDYENSIENQKDILIKLAKKDNIDLDNLIIVEEIKSWAKWKDREWFNKMINTLEKDKNKYKWCFENRKYWWIYFFKIDRLARNDESFQIIFDLLESGYTFKSATETIENTPTWRLLFRMLSSFAIFESEKLSNRERIEHIHNITLQNFKKLWWKTAIIWYKYTDKGNIKIINEEKEIILKIYELFLLHKESKKTITYQEIFEIIDAELNWKLKKLLLKKSKAPNGGNFVESILKNKKMIQYNWYIERWLKVDDELIKNYIDTIMEKNEHYFELLWSNKIWNTVKFSFFYQNLIIVNDILYNRVQNYINENKYKNINKSKKTFNWLFEDILFFNR